MIKQTYFLPAAGDKYLDFVVTKVKFLEELNCYLRELVHLPTGAQVIHIENDDPENLFCLSFKTLPSTSNGVAHILEHTVLCGSKRFPVKDPFFSMQRRSLNTFMNALTGSDFTCYPAASQVETDFYNLLDVYIDAVFHPQLKRLSFLQEGHRLEFADFKDPNTPLEIKGIVFNEMKGNLSSSEPRLWHRMMADLVPDLPYAHNSGGDPQEIPHLTYAELISFHEMYYHPSRCLFFFYGNLPLQKHLDFITEKVLKGVPKLPPLPNIPRQKRFSAPKYVEMSYPINETEEEGSRCIISLGFLTAPLVDQEDVLALTVLDCILMENDASLLKKKLLDSKLCIQADAYMDVDMSEVPYVISCKGCDEKSGKLLEKTIKEALSEIIEEGIPHALIDAAVHQLELSRLEIAGDHAPFGLTLFMRSALAKQHGCDPEDALKVHALFETLLFKSKDPSYFTAILKKYFLDNPHYVLLSMHPDPELSSKELAEEKRMLQEKQKQLTSQESLHILSQAEELRSYQKEIEGQSLECLPKISMSDIPLVARDFPLRHHRYKELDVFHHDCFTNHILYVDFVFDLPPIPDQDLPLVHLLTTLLSEIGTGGRSYEENLEYTQAHTGGIGASCGLFLQISDTNKAQPAFIIRGKALHRKADKLFTLLQDTLISPVFNDKKRITHLIQQLRESQMQRLNRQAMRYAIQLAMSGLSPSGHVSEAWMGLRYYKAIEALSKDLKSNISALIDKLISLKEYLFTFHNPHLVLSCSKEMVAELEKKHFYGLADLPCTPRPHWDLNYPLIPVPSQGRAIASQVAFTAEAYPSITYIHPHSSALALAATLFENKVLHRRIREQGGAYGSGATYNPSNGKFYFHSFRDPHIANTLKSFHAAIDEIASGHITAQDIEEAKLGVIQHLDVPISPGSRAFTAYNWHRIGKTKEMRQRFRDHLLALTPQKTAHVVETELSSKKDKGTIVTFAGKELLASENALLTQEGRPLKILPL